MIKASYSDKSVVVDILASSFDTNKSINFIAKQDSKRKQRVKVLMEYSFELCYVFGEVYLSDDRKACALVLFPERREMNLKTIFLDMKLALNCIGLERVGQVLKREALIKGTHPRTPMIHLFMLGVSPDFQKRGRGTELIKQVIQKSVQEERPVILETSTLANIPWYEKFGFKVENELDLGYKLFILKRDFLN